MFRSRFPFWFSVRNCKCHKVIKMCSTHQVSLVTTDSRANTSVALIPESVRALHLWLNELQVVNFQPHSSCKLARAHLLWAMHFHWAFVIAQWTCVRQLVDQLAQRWLVNAVICTIRMVRSDHRRVPPTCKCHFQCHSVVTTSQRFIRPEVIHQLISPKTKFERALVVQ